jgi:hypothetical protein
MLELILYGIRRKNIYTCFHTTVSSVVIFIQFILKRKKQREFGDLDAIKS